MPKKRGGMKNKMLNLNVTDEQALYNSYLPFLTHGGLFIPTERPYKLGDEVFLLLNLMNQDKAPVAGKVAWINPAGAAGGRPAGIGVHFSEQDKGVTREKIEKALANLLKSDKKTYTM
ncbi:PilZ domain-containing protein [Candidatus Parabeggiatoa sp. HSG14]|uniref:PilZ domain-containing protein n=1 Tax=Candidatus Parabeggiatoa sp. HSG14 TaxID=3055593 RepID=UPI0032E4450D